MHRYFGLIYLNIVLEGLKQLLRYVIKKKKKMHSYSSVIIYRENYNCDYT